MTILYGILLVIAGFCIGWGICSALNVSGRSDERAEFIMEIMMLNIENHKLSEELHTLKGQMDKGTE